MQKFKAVLVELIATYGCGPMTLLVIDDKKLDLDDCNLSDKDIMNKYSDRLVDHYDVEFDSDYQLRATIYLKGEF